MKQKLCFHAVKAMLLHSRFRHIAAKNKAVLLSKTVVSACFYAEITAQNLCGVRNSLWYNRLRLHTISRCFHGRMIFISEYRGYRTLSEIRKKAFCVIRFQYAGSHCALCRPALFRVCSCIAAGPMAIIYHAVCLWSMLIFSIFASGIWKWTETISCSLLPKASMCIRTLSLP